jgi:hypothetical protein
VEFEFEQKDKLSHSDWRKIKKKKENKEKVRSGRMKIATLRAERLGLDGLNGTLRSSLPNSAWDMQQLYVNARPQHKSMRSSFIISSPSNEEDSDWSAMHHCFPLQVQVILSKEILLHV